SSRRRRRRGRSGPPLSRLQCRTRPGPRRCGCGASHAPRTPRARAPRHGACTRTRRCRARPPPGCARTPAGVTAAAGHRAAARRGARARSCSLRMWWSSVSLARVYIYLWPVPHGSWPVSVRLLALIPVAVAISLALSAAVDAVALPLFLDTTGTILATALAGPVVGIAVGVLTSAVNTLRNPPFSLFAIAAALPAFAWILPAPTGGLATAGLALMLPLVPDPRWGVRVVRLALLTAAPFWLFLRLLHDGPTTVAIGGRITTMVAS